MLPRSAPRSVASVVVILPREESRFDGRSMPWRLFVMRSIGTAFFCSTPATSDRPGLRAAAMQRVQRGEGVLELRRDMVGGTSP